MVRVLIVNNIVLSLDASVDEAFSRGLKKLRSIGINSQSLKSKIYRKSIDARRKNDIKLVYSIAFEGDFPDLSDDKLSKINAHYEKYDEPDFIIGSVPLNDRPIIVGSGPAGLFCGLLLAENGYKPIILERGGCIADRIKAVDDFKKSRVLDVDTNIQFGAGGAGTFSDGKLITRINDPMSSYVLRRFVEFGAPEDIVYTAKPHIGTDILCKVVDLILDRIIELGGTVKYNTKFLDADFEHEKISSVKTDRGDISAGALILAIGHSARDTYLTLLKRGLNLESKNFSVGMRIEHPATSIDEAMYGSFAGHKALGHAEYSLSYNTKVRGVYTFCMCPGGVVVPASSEEGGVVVNGMSYHARDGVNSNSAVVCSIFKEDFNANPLDAIEFQRKIEKNAFISGGCDYSAPLITVGDFISGKVKTEPTVVKPTYMDCGVKLISPYDYFPAFVCDNIKNALSGFNNKISGFSSPYALLTGPETRTSAPIRILRNNTNYLALGYKNLYPIGEGAGYAGGITSASIDGVRAAITIMQQYSPKFNPGEI